MFNGLPKKKNGNEIIPVHYQLHLERYKAKSIERNKNEALIATTKAYTRSKKKKHLFWEESSEIELIKSKIR